MELAINYSILSFPDTDYSFVAYFYYQIITINLKHFTSLWLYIKSHLFHKHGANVLKAGAPLYYSVWTSGKSHNDDVLLFIITYTRTHTDTHKSTKTERNL